MEQELEMYITETKEYGKPSDDAINHFINSTLASIIIDKPKRLENKTIETNINSKWLGLVKDGAVDDIRSTATLFSGGYDFYYYLSKQDIKDKQSLRIAIEQYTIPELPRINDSLRNILKQYNGVQIYQVSHVDGTYHYLVAQNNGDIKTYNENGTQLSNTIDIELLAHLKSISFKQEYLGTDINAFLNIPLNNVSEFDLYVRCDSIESLSTIINQHNIIDNVAHANMSDTSMISADSLESDKAEKSYDSHNASTANIADGLTDNAIEKVVESFTDSIVNGDKKEILDAIEQKIFEKQQERREKEKWSYPVSVYTHEFESLDVYRNETLENADRHLTNSHRLLIIGSTGDGKTELAYYMAHKLTGENIGANRDSSYFNRICIGSARDARPIYTEKDSEYIGKLNRFIRHIKDNDITEPCVFICNEIQASDMGYILGENLWEEFNNSGISEILPDNLYLIFTGCKDRDFGIDSQILQRIPSVEIGYISSNFEDKHEKMLKAFDGVNDNLIDILKLVEDINDTEGYPIISMRKFKDILTGKPFDLGINDESILSSETIRALDKLREQYGN